MPPEIINLEQLELLVIDYTDLNYLSLIIRKLVNLRTIKMGHLNSAVVLNLFKLNNERRDLARAKKLTIYVPENVFQKTKWTTRNGDIDISHIIMKRR